MFQKQFKNDKITHFDQRNDIFIGIVLKMYDFTIERDTFLPLFEKYILQIWN